jgi:SnoaL-like polyketide cyclase
VTAQWLMHGTKNGPIVRPAPTGRPVALRGVDVIALADGKIGSVEGYFDRQALAEELGFQMRPLLPVAGPFQFGYAARTSPGTRKVPGAVSLPWVPASLAPGTSTTCRAAHGLTLGPGSGRSAGLVRWPGHARCS